MGFNNESSLKTNHREITESTFLWPSYVQQVVGKVNKESPFIEITFEDPIIFITGIHASFEGESAKATIEILLGDISGNGDITVEKDVFYKHTFFNLLYRQQNERTNMVSICPQSNINKISSGGSMNTAFPNLIIANYKTKNSSKIIKVRMKVDFSGCNRSESINAKLAVMTSSIPLDYYIQ